MAVLLPEKEQDRLIFVRQISPIFSNPKFSKKLNILSAGRQHYAASTY